MDWQALLTAENALALVTLTALEIVLGIDNIVFIAILVDKLEASKRKSARTIGLALAMITRILLLLSISWMMGLTEPWFTFTPFNLDHEISGRDLILLAGGLFLIGKATFEIHDKLEAHGEHGITQRRAASYASVIVQILLLDIVFSLDSVITAVGMAKEIAVMIAAVIIAVLVMLVFAGTVSRFVERHPTLKMLALSFLLMIGVMLTAEAFHVHVPKGYVYFAMGSASSSKCSTSACESSGAQKHPTRSPRGKLRGPQAPMPNSPAKSIAIVGASDNRAKFGNKAVRAYQRAGWTVYAVNPTVADEIEGAQTVARMDEIPEPVDRVSLYLPESVALPVLAEIAAHSPKTELFLNPGADAPAVIREAERLGLWVVQACSIVDIGLSPAMFP